VNTEEQRRTAFVDLELAAVWEGHERGVVTIDEVHQRLEELERLLWRRVLGRLRKLTPGASVYVGFAVGEQPAQELA
jgi:superfamily II helicase